MATPITAKLERDVSMPRCRNLSAFFGKRCVADHTVDTPSLMPSQKQQRKRTISNKDGVSAAFAPQKSILKLLSEPLVKNNSSVQGIGFAVPLTQNEEETLEGAGSCQESASKPAQVSSNLSEQMKSDLAQNCERELLHLISNETREVAPKSMDGFELQKSKIMEGNDREVCLGETKARYLEPGGFQEQASLQSSSASKEKLSVEQIKAGCDAEVFKVHAMEHCSVKICTNQQLTQLCMEHQLIERTGQLSQAGRGLGVEHDAPNVCQDVCSNIEGPLSVVHATSVQGDGNKTGGAEICASNSGPGAGQINTAASSTAEEHKLGCTKDQEERKLIEVVQRRSSRIKKVVKYVEEDINTLSMGTGSCMEEQEDPNLPISNSAQKVCGNDSTSRQSDFFLPVSKRSRKQKLLEETPTLVSNGEKRQRDGKVGQLHKGNSATNHEEFFVPASKKQKQVVNTLDPMIKEVSDEKMSTFQFDLWTEARLAAEENAQLCVGKPTHPFFSQHRGGQRASPSLGVSANACFLHQVACSEEVELVPSPPFHITQLTEAVAGTTDVGSWASSRFLQNLKADQTSSRRECFDLKELDGVLRVPTVDKLSVVIRRNHASRGTPLDNVLEPLLKFLKDSDSVSIEQNTTEEDDLDCSLAYLKERLNSFFFERAKRCSVDSCNVMSSSTDEESTSKNSLWTNVYQPQSPKEVCGNKESVNCLSAWLERWQAGGAITTGFSEGDSIQRKKSKNEDMNEGGGCFQEDSNSEGEAREDAALQNVLFLAGPVGCGKTAAIYACARVHGYTVIEVNCSDNRNGLLIKQKFSESMESHRVGKWSADTIGPGNASYTMQGASTPADLNVTTSSHVTESMKTRHVSKEKRQKQKQNQKRKNDDTTQTSNIPNKPAPNTDVKAKQLNESMDCDKSMTVLLFEDVDMVFEDDRGFMAAVAQVAATAKRPIILTSNDKRLCLPQSLGAELLEFTKPSTKELVVLAYLVCVAEGLPCRPEFLSQMVKLCRHDLRILLNHLQFWCQGHAIESSSEITDQKNVAKYEKEAATRPYLSSEEADSAFVTRLFKLEAQHRLWPSFISWSFPCKVTQLVACKLNDRVSQAERRFSSDEEKKLENDIAEKLASLKKCKRQKVDSPLKSAAELSDNLETPVKNVKEAKAVARSPILREKLRKDLATTMLGVIDEPNCKECDHQVVLQTLSKQDSIESENHFEPLNAQSLVICASNGANPVVTASPIKNGKIADDACMLAEEFTVCRGATRTADFEVESTPSTKSTAESNQSLISEDQPPTEIGTDPGKSVLQSISEPIYNMWSEFQSMREKQGLILSSASEESYTTTVFLSELSDNLSSSDIMSCVHGPGKTFLGDDTYCWESPEDSSMLQACSMFAHKSLVLCIQECAGIPNSPEELRPTISIEDMMLAINDPCAMGKIFTHDEAFSSREFQPQIVMASHQEQQSERYRKKSSLQRALCSELPAKVQVFIQGASFFEYASFLARMGHLEHDRPTSGAVRRRGRGFQNYFRTHPWNLSKESINIIEQFGRFSTSSRCVDLENATPRCMYD